MKQTADPKARSPNGVEFVCCIKTSCRECKKGWESAIGQISKLCALGVSASSWKRGAFSLAQTLLVPVAAAAKLLQLCPTLCDLIDGSPPGSSVPGILQARTLEWVAILQCMKVKSEREVAQSCPTPSDPMDCSLPGSSVHGIFQARVLEWSAIVFS